MSDQEKRIQEIVKALRDGKKRLSHIAWENALSPGSEELLDLSETCKESADLIESLQREQQEPEPLTEAEEVRNAFFALVIAERSAQDRKWGYPQLNTLCEWGSYLAVECGESIKELNDLNFGSGSKEKLVTELVHTAAMCLAILQQYDSAVDVTRKKRDYVYATEPKGEHHD